MGSENLIIFSDLDSPGISTLFAANINNISDTPKFFATKVKLT